jgi:DNA-binding transcriptional regulator GbsR (MarR family)
MESSNVLENSNQTGRPRLAHEERLEKRVLHVCDRAGAFIEWWGFKAIHGRVWTLLALHQGPMPQNMIAQTLGVSRALVSQAISELLDFGLVQPVSDHRNAPYEATVDVWPTISDILRTREWMLLESARVALESAINEARLQRAAGHTVTFDIEQMRMLMRMTESAQAFLKMIVGLRMPKPMENLGSLAGKAASLMKNFRNRSS